MEERKIKGEQTKIRDQERRMKKVKVNKESLRNKDVAIKEKLMEALCSRSPGLKSRPLGVVFENLVTLFSRHVHSHPLITLPYALYSLSY